MASFLQAVDTSYLAITDFTLYSIGIILTRLKKFDAFKEFIKDTVEDGSIKLIYLSPAELLENISV